MNKEELKQLFPTLETELFEEMVKHGSIKQVKAGDTLLKVGQTIRSTMLILDGLVKLYREDDEGKEFFIYHLDAGQACSLSMVCAAKHETSEVLAKALNRCNCVSHPFRVHGPMDEQIQKLVSVRNHIVQKQV